MANETADETVLARYFFLPWLRAGLAALIDAPAEGMRARVDVKITPTGTGGGVTQDELEISPPGGIELMGPGDIIGFNESVITRREPERDVGDREPNFFPIIEFAQPDFPWRFTASKEDGEFSRVLPWITLVVLIAEDKPEKGISQEFSNGCDSSLYPKPLAPTITVTSIDSLPDLAESWRWAHVQITTGEEDPDLLDIIRNNPEAVVARLMCARRLRPGTLYQAFVVPSFKLGVMAGLGIEGEASDTALTPAWDSSEGSSSDIALPYYHSWQFRTGLRGDFESLVRRLEPRGLTGLGIRQVGCSQAGYGVPAVTRIDEDTNIVNSLGLESALSSLDMRPDSWGHDAWVDTPPAPEDNFQQQLANDLLNLPKADLEGSTDVPKVVPPVYGRWHAARDEVSPSSRAWLDMLNLDPRHRMTAAFGTKVVQQQQEQLMAAAWDQIGAIDEANEILRRAQLGREISLRVYNQRLVPMSYCDLIRVTAPLHARVLTEAESGDEGKAKTVRYRFKGRPALAAALDPATRRMWRRGPVRKRQRRDGDPNRKDVLERLNEGSLHPAGPHPTPDGILSTCRISYQMLEKTGMIKIADKICPDALGKNPSEVAEKLNLFCEANLSCDFFEKMQGRPDFAINRSGMQGKVPEGKDNDAATAFREYLSAICSELWPSEEPSEELAPIDLGKMRDTLLQALDPHKTIVARFKNKHRLRLTGVKEQADPLDPIMAAPEFPAPMYDPLQAISQDLLLAGLETVPQNTLGLLKTNGRFLEAYMVGLNHEMARELLWREYPTDQRGSYFRQFWDVSNVVPEASLLEELENEVRSELEQQVSVGEELPDNLDAYVLDEVERHLAEKLKDINRIHEWRTSELGQNDNRPVATNGDEENLVLIIRGDLLRKYPNTNIYAVQAKRPDGGARAPGLPEHRPDDVPEEEWVGDIKRPIFSGQIPPDVTFLGFDITPTQARGGMANNEGWYFVIEERISEARFGMDMATVPEENAPADWDSLSWGHIEDLDLEDDQYLDDRQPIPASDDDNRKWDDSANTSAASIAWITLQKPVRISVHASKMIPEI